MLSALGHQQSLLRSQLSIHSLLGIFLDPLIIIASLFGVAFFHEETIDASYVILALIVFSLSFPGTSRLNDRFRKLLRDIIISWCLLAALLFFFGYASGYLKQFPQQVILAWFLVTPTALVAANEIARRLVPRILSLQGYQRTAVIVGISETGLRLAKHFYEKPYLGTKVTGFFDDRDSHRLNDPLVKRNLLGKMDKLAEFVRKNSIDLIYITLPMTTQPRILALLEDLRDTTASIYFAPDIFVTDLIQGQVDDIAGMPVVAVCDTPFNGANGLIKRSSDIILSLLILTLIAPIMLAIAIGVKISSPGTILFKQRRYGVDGKEIIVYKFRSMTVCEDGDHVTQASRNDKRVTPFGAILRKTSLDELPQFINVLQGRMSIVGPRPHAVAHNELYRKLIRGYMVRHKVKPGITGWAQVSGYRGETETVDKMQKRIEYDLEYLRHWSLGLDLWIIMKTILIVVRDRHAY